MHITDRSASQVETVDIIIDAEVSAYRRGFISLTIDLPAKLFRYRDSNQWNNNFVRALNESDVKTICRAVAEWPDHEICTLPDAGSLHWQVTLHVGDCCEMYEGNRNSDRVWRHLNALVEAIGGK